MSLLNQETLAKLLTLVMESVKTEIDQLQKQVLVELVKIRRENEAVVPILEKLNEKITTIENAPKPEQQPSLKVIEEHIHKHVVNEFPVVPLPEDVARRPELTNLKDQFQQSLDVLSEQISFLKSYEYPEYAKKEHDHSVYAISEDVRANIGDVHTRLNDLRESLNDYALALDVRLKLDGLTESDRELRESFEQELQRVRDSIATAVREVHIKETYDDKNLRDVLSEESERLDGLILEMDDRIAGVDATIREQLGEEIEKTGKNLEEKIKQVASHTHTEFVTQRVLEEKVQEVVKKIKSSTPTAKDLEGQLQKLVQDEIKKVPVPKPKDPVSWEFKFHPTRKGVLLFKRTDQKDWSEQDLTVHASPPKGWMDNGLGGGGTIDVLINGIMESNNAFQFDFISSVPGIVGLNTRQRVEINIDKIIQAAGGGTSPSGIRQYTQALSGFSVSIPFSTHGIQYIAGLVVVNSSNDVVSVQENIAVNSDVQISSNVDLTGHTIRITG